MDTKNSPVNIEKNDDRIDRIFAEDIKYIVLERNFRMKGDWLELKIVHNDGHQTVAHLTGNNREPIRIHVEED